MAQKELGKGKSDSATSEIIGELLLLSITVLIFALLIGSISMFTTKQRTEIVHINALAINSTALKIEHAGGDTLPYGQLAVVVDGRLIQATGSDINRNGLWDLGESLTVTGVNATGSLDVVVYDSSTNYVLGNLNIDPAAGQGATQTPTPTPTTTPAPTTTPTPGPTATTTPTPTATPTPVPHMDHLAITASSPWTGLGDTLRVTAYDQYGNIYTGYRGSVYFDSDNSNDYFIYKNNGHAYDFTAADGGVHVFTIGFILQRTSGTHKVTVTDQHSYSAYVNINY